ncbi:nuclear transport factor 2 family protein [Cochleicola gelatinilyticus]|uniref:3-methyl-2-oxobutanoate hydroxymethyltransferase n=1 Tax=Cochleicola gelatinilyticus TaxID=1763537 RepID=A0A167HPI6_9FLAO|nr:nuclear transport factor 2 family protein [Cochleicola gelatinilyticus]OAB78827.1 hypothetical protein ULVI_09610 [Cochleicola gelatinilyticus]
MKYLFFLIVTGISTLSFSQNELSEANAKLFIDVFFDGFHSGDTLKMKSVMMPNMMMQSAYVQSDGENKVRYSRGSDFLKVIAARPEGQVWDEQILGYEVLSDGNLAHVWTPYRFYVDGKFSHCGANSFTLVYTDESWKILNIIDSRRVGSCEKEE